MVGKNSQRHTLAEQTQHLRSVLASSHPEIEICDSTDYEACLDVWFESFASDPPNPMFRWIVADEKLPAAEEDRRFREQLRYMLHFVNRPYKKKGILLAVRDEAGVIVAAASVLPPGASVNPFAPTNLVAAGVPPVYKHRAKWGSVPAKKLSTFSTTDKAKAELRRTLGPCWYLLCLGVKSHCQGKGYGRVLMRALCDVADSQQAPLHLECESEWHEKLYSRYGFQTEKYLELQVKEDPAVAPQYLMVRRPRVEQQDGQRVE